MTGSRSSLLWSWVGVFIVAGSALLYGAVDEGAPRTNADRAYALAQVWPKADLKMVRNAGHALSEPGISAELVRAMDRIAPT